jgi:hypothetical protein
MFCSKEEREKKEKKEKRKKKGSISTQKGSKENCKISHLQLVVVGESLAPTIHDLSKPWPI